MQSNPANFYVAADGRDHNPGTLEQPFASLAQAKIAAAEALKAGNAPVTVSVGEGTYYLDQPLTFAAAESGAPGVPLTFRASPGAVVTLSGGQRLNCQWKPFRDGIWMCELPEKTAFTQLFVNGKRQIRARYPDYDPSDPREFRGYIRAAGEIDPSSSGPSRSADDDMIYSGEPPRGITFDPVTFSKKRWQHPEQAVIHIFHAHYWGNLQWQLQGVDWDQHQIWFGSGGQQMNSGACHVSQESYFFIENVFEELDAPGEWYLDGEKAILYYLPEAGVDLEHALVEIPYLAQVIRLVGSQHQPVHDIAFENFRIAHTSSTFLEEYCIPSRSDWSIHRGGAVFMEGARDCTLKACYFDAVGGNAVFMNGYNRGNQVSSCKFVGTGDSAICFVGYYETSVGSQKKFPFECRADNNLIHDCGVFGKQVAGVYISRARRITASHNEIYQMPRAGICIGDGTWGGHIIEFNHIHETCLETSDHGPFNAWGRDSSWCLVQSHLPYTTHRSHDVTMVKNDVLEPIIIRNNHFEEIRGWGIDLDDGSSNYEVYNNLCVGVSIKLREGAYRSIYNNIWVNGANAPSFHVGYESNHDRYFHNITVIKLAHMAPEDDINFSMAASYGEVYAMIAPPAHTAWLEELDYNCFYSDLGEFVAWVEPRLDVSFDTGWDESTSQRKQFRYSLAEWQALGYDRNSIFADPLFVDPANHDYRLRSDSPALTIGFESFDPREAGLTTRFHP